MQLVLFLKDFRALKDFSATLVLRGQIGPHYKRVSYVSKFWNWIKMAFTKAQPVVQRLEPVAVQIAESANPKLTPMLDAATVAATAIRGAVNQKA